MWMIDPKRFCRLHLLSEHNEIHLLIGCMRKNKSIKGYMNKRQLQLNAIFSRHEELVKEMKRRGYNHNSPIDPVEVEKLINGNIDYYLCQNNTVDIEFNKKDLFGRCKLCQS
jgi:hypothetical protein